MADDSCEHKESFDEGFKERHQKLFHGKGTQNKELKKIKGKGLSSEEISGIGGGADDNYWFYFAE